MSHVLFTFRRELIGEKNHPATRQFWAVLRRDADGITSGKNSNGIATYSSSSKFESLYTRSRQMSWVEGFRHIRKSNVARITFTIKLTSLSCNGISYRTAVSTTMSPHSPAPSTTPPIFSTFRPATEFEISNILLNFPDKQSDSDPIPTWLLKNVLQFLFPLSLA